MPYLTRLENDATLTEEQIAELKHLLGRYVESDMTFVCRKRLDYLTNKNIMVKVEKYVKPDNEARTYHVRADATQKEITLRVPIGKTSPVADIAQTLVFEIGNVMNSNSETRKRDKKNRNLGLIGPIEYGRNIARDEGENAWEFTRAIEDLNHRNFNISNQSMKYIKEKHGKTKNQYLNDFAKSKHEKTAVGTGALPTEERYAYETIAPPRTESERIDSPTSPEAQAYQFLEHAVEGNNIDIYKDFVWTLSRNVKIRANEVLAFYCLVTRIVKKVAKRGKVPSWRNWGWQLKAPYEFTEDMRKNASLDSSIDPSTKNGIKRELVEVCRKFEKKINYPYIQEPSPNDLADLLLKESP